MKSYLNEQPFVEIGSSDISNNLSKPEGINSEHSRGGSVSTPWAADPAANTWAELGNQGIDAAIRGMVDANTPLVLEKGEEVK